MWTPRLLQAPPDGAARAGDSITIAPAQTLTDKEYQRLRDASIAIIRDMGVETGGSNVQMAVNPDDGQARPLHTLNPKPYTPNPPHPHSSILNPDPSTWGQAPVLQTSIAAGQMLSKAGQRAALHGGAASTESGEWDSGLSFQDLGCGVQASGCGRTQLWRVWSVASSPSRSWI